MKSKENLRKKWSEFMKMPFPKDCIGMEINNICITSLDSTAAGCIDTFITDGYLDANKKNILIDCLNDLQFLLPNLNGYSEEYLSKLKILCEEIINID